MQLGDILGSGETGQHMRMARTQRDQRMPPDQSSDLHTGLTPTTPGARPTTHTAPVHRHATPRPSSDAVQISRRRSTQRIRVAPLGFQSATRSPGRGVERLAPGHTALYLDRARRSREHCPRPSGESPTCPLPPLPSRTYRSLLLAAPSVRFLWQCFRTRVVRPVFARFLYATTSKPPSAVLRCSNRYSYPPLRPTNSPPPVTVQHPG